VAGHLKRLLLVFLSVAGEILTESFHDNIVMLDFVPCPHWHQQMMKGFHIFLN